MKQRIYYSMMLDIRTQLINSYFIYNKFKKSCLYKKHVKYLN